MHTRNADRGGLRRNGGWAVLLAGSVLLGPAAWGQDVSDVRKPSAVPPASESAEFECGYRAPADWVAELQAAAVRGEIPGPAGRAIPPIRMGTTRTERGGQPCLSPEHIFPFEDTDQVLLTNFSDGQLIDLMITAANDLLSVHGDNFDFVGYWVNSTPNHQIGAAFYAGIENDVSGIGLDLFNFRREAGLGGQNIDGFVMMWNINTSYWAPGDGSDADFTRLALGQEFEHRFAMFLPDLLDGRRLQGDNGSCGRGAHWSWKVDGQGSSMEISEWVGSNPAILQGSFVTFNTDIVGGVFSYTDLYLMGYVSPSEMDAGNSELRYMDDSTCGLSYNGPISHFTSAGIIASAGARIPDSAAAQKHFRTGWIMIHQPGDPPSATELNKAVGILEQHMIDWTSSTLGRGTMDNTIFDDCNCNDIPDADDIAEGGSLDCNGNDIPDECEDLCVADEDCDDGDQCTVDTCDCEHPEAGSDGCVHDQCEPTCTGNELMRFRCRPLPNGNFTIIVAIFLAEPGEVLTIRRDGDPSTDKQMTIQATGRGRIRFGNLPPDSYSFEVLECDVDGTRTCP